MAKLHNTLVLVSILGAYGIAHADNTSPTHQPPVNNSSTQISNTISNGYDNTTSNVNLSAYAEVLVVDEVFDPQADALANASVNDIQKNLNNKLNVTDPSKAALRNSVAHIDGNAGVNNASGFFNQQANNVAISSTGSKNSVAKAATNFEQLNNDNTFNFEEPYRGTSNDMTASVKGSIKDVNGNVGVNNAAGAGNQQKNDVALANASSALLASASTGGVQLNQNTIVTSSLPLNVSASLSDSVKNVTGNVGVNNAAGLGNQQINTLSIASASGK
ncbi:MAG TPA: hypothetical protein VJ642_04365 [Chromobacteriaceae bacterium]|nr:hypothetical protein [Chromobacteriaceae bacterium]